MKVALTIGGSDSTGGAGVQMDLKVFQALGVYGTCVITALTAQNTTAVKKIHSLSRNMIDIQFKTLLSDIKPYGTKTGMIYSEEAVECIVHNIKKYKIKNLVIDPVIVSSTGKRLIEKSAFLRLKEELIPLSTAITANVPEAEVLSGIKINCQESILEASKIIMELGTKFIIIKGGHFDHTSTDFLYDGKNLYMVEGEKFPGQYHGTGCAFSSAFVAFLCLGYDPKEALHASKNFVKNAIRNALKLGMGMYLLKI